MIVLKLEKIFIVKVNISLNNYYTDTPVSKRLALVATAAQAQ